MSSFSTIVVEALDPKFREKHFKNVLLDDKCFSDIIVTKNRNGVVAITARCQRTSVSSIGGTRCVKEKFKSTAEVEKLSSAMQEKNALILAKMDGQKTAIYFGGLIPRPEEKARIIAEHIKYCNSCGSGFVFGPDLNVDEGIQDMLASEGLLSSLTGVSRKFAGYEIDATGMTAHGLFVGIAFTNKTFHQDYKKIAVEGFGNVGANLALKAYEAGYRIMAVSNINGTLISLSEEGLVIDELVNLWKEHGDTCITFYNQNHVEDTVIRDRQAIFTVECEIFCPCARTSTLSMKSESSDIFLENSESYPIEKFIGETGVKVIAEGANAPLTLRAERFAEEQGIRVLPDVVVNCGGLTACLDEWEIRERSSSLAEARQALDEVKIKKKIAFLVERNLAFLFSSPNPVREALKDLIQHNLDALAGSRSA